MDNELASVCMKILKREVVPALGCTEPVAVALASALAARDLGMTPERIAVRVSGHLYKNGMGVMVPGTGRFGLAIAAAAGALGGAPDRGLEVLETITPDIAARAGAMVDAGKATVDLADTPKVLYAEAAVSAGGDTARVVIEDSHTGVTLRERNGHPLFSAATAASVVLGDADWPLSLAAIWEFADQPSREAVDFMLETARLNGAAADEGLSGDYGLGVGKCLAPRPGDILGDDVANYAIRLTAAGSDLRMAGAMMPVMSNSGSGNQGIACTLPLLAVARRLGIGDLELAKALLVSHLVSIHIKHFIGRLSALCGAINASTGASCGLVRLLGGNLEDAGRAIRNMAGDLAGMICDGAKYTCALKVATTTASAIKAARLALDNRAPDRHNGIVADDAEASIRHLARLACEGMRETEKVILDIMIDKALGREPPQAE